VDETARTDGRLHASTFTAGPPRPGDRLDVVRYGPEIPTEAELRLLGHLDGKRVLDLGCGAGPAAVAMARQGARVIAMDESAEQIGYARALAEREDVKVEFRDGDLAELAFIPADAIDVAVSVYALGAVDDINRVFRQVHRVLKPEAPFVFSLPHPMFLAIDDRQAPPTLRRPYFDSSVIDWQEGTVFGIDVQHTVADLFTSLGRANFRVDSVLEPEPLVDGGPHSRYWTEAMRWVPATLIVRARKQGT
jgi:SAM-dependent methyltransferase